MKRNSQKKKEKKITHSFKEDTIFEQIISNQFLEKNYYLGLIQNQLKEKLKLIDEWNSR